MARFNTGFIRPRVTSPVKSTGRTARNHQGATGHLRDGRSELFLLAVANFVSQQTFHEDGAARDDRFAALVRKLAVEDPEWTAGLLRWLRREGRMRTASLVGAAEYVRARLDAGAVDGPSNRQAVDSVLLRADEPGELLGHWTSRYGRAVPKPVKRGIADAVRRLYGGKALLKYDTASKGYRFGDILNLVHAAPDPAKAWQGDLFRYALDRRHHPEDAVPPASNRTLTAHRELMEVPVAERRALVTGAGGADRLAAAGMTWEALAGWLQGPMDAAAWEAVIPSMGAMALLRSLRNFDEAGVSDEVAAGVAARISGAEEVAACRQFPFRYLAAYRHAPSLRWAYPLEQALGHSLGNVPALPGRTLVLVDPRAPCGRALGPLAAEPCRRRGRLRRGDGAAGRRRGPGAVRYGQLDGRVPAGGVGAEGPGPLRQPGRHQHLRGGPQALRGARPGTDRHRRAGLGHRVRERHRRHPGHGARLHLEPRRVPGRARAGGTR